MQLGKKIQTIRKQKGLTQEQLASELSVTRQAVSKWENDEAVPDVETIVKLCKVFQISTDTLLGDFEQTATDPSRPLVQTPLLGKKALHLFETKGHVAGYLLALRYIPGVLIAAALVFYNLSRMARFMPLKDYPVQAFIAPIAFGIVGLGLLLHAFLCIFLAIKFKKHTKKSSEV